MSIRAQAAAGLKWQVIGIALKGVMGLVFMALIARLLKPESFGVVAVSNVIIGFAVMLTEFGFGSALVQLDNVGKKQFSASFFLSLGTGVVVFVGLYLLSPLISNYYDNEVPLLVLQIVSLLIVPKALMTVYKSLMIRHMQFKRINQFEVISFLAGNMAVGLSMAYYGYEYWAIIAAQFAGTLLTVLLMAVAVKQSIAIKVGKEPYKEVLNFGASLTMIRVVNILSKKVDKILIGKYFNLGLLGFYERYQGMIELPQRHTGSAIDSVLYSLISRLKSEEEKLRSFLQVFYALILLLFGASTVVLFVYPEVFIEIVLGERWLEQAGVFKALVLTIPPFILMRFFDTYIRSRAYMAKTFFIKLINLIGVIAVILYCAYKNVGLETTVYILSLLYTMVALFYAILIFRLMKWGGAEAMAIVRPMTINALAIVIVSLLPLNVYLQMALVAIVLAGLNTVGYKLVFGKQSEAVVDLMGVLRKTSKSRK